MSSGAGGGGGIEIGATVAMVDGQLADEPMEGVGGTGTRRKEGRGGVGGGEENEEGGGEAGLAGGEGRREGAGDRHEEKRRPRIPPKKLRMRSARRARREGGGDEGVAATEVGEALKGVSLGLVGAHSLLRELE